MFTNCWWWSILGEKCSLFGGYIIIIWAEWCLSRVFGILLQIHQKILAWVRPPPLFLAMPRFSRRLLQHSLPYKESCVQLPMASLKGCHQLYGSSYDYHIIDCTHVPRRPCRTLTLRKKKVEGHWYDPPWHELSENLKKFLRTSSGISSLQELLAELVLTTHYRRM